MKKILAIILAMVLLFAIASCKKADENTDSDSDNNVVGEDVYKDAEGDDIFTYDVNEDGVYEIIGFSSTNDTPHKIEIPAKINNIDVAGIAKEAFKVSNKITEVVIPDTVTYIDDLAFFGCNYLTTVSMPDSVTELGIGVFQDCVSLKTVKLSGKLEVVSEFAFKGCTAIEAITIPASVKTIKEAAFYQCTALKEIVIPEGVKTIGDGAFFENKALTKAVVPATVETLGAHIFANANEEFAVHGAEGSAAEKYAADNGYKFTKVVVAA